MIHLREKELLFFSVAVNVRFLINLSFYYRNSSNTVSGPVHLAISILFFVVFQTENLQIKADLFKNKKSVGVYNNAPVTQPEI